MRKNHKFLAVLALVLAVLPVALYNVWLVDVAVRVLIAAGVAISLNLLMGYTGQVSLGHAAFYAIGAYGSAILTTRFGWPPFAALATTAFAAAMIALVISRPIFMLRGHYLAMATLGLGALVNVVLNTETAWTGGPDGMSVPALSLFGWSVERPMAWYAVAAVLLLLVSAGAIHLVTSPFGRAMQAIHGSEVAARSSGIDVGATKTKVFVLSAFLTSLLGSISAHYLGFVTPGVAGVLHSIEMVTMVVIGGMASIGGSIVGAVVVVLLPELLSKLEGIETIVFGAILVGGMILVPRGIVPSLRRRS